MTCSLVPMSMMAFFAALSTPRAHIASNPGVMGGAPVIDGTRVLAATIVSCLQGGLSEDEIRQDHPDLPCDTIAVVSAWAEQVHGPGWRQREPDVAPRV